MAEPGRALLPDPPLPTAPRTAFAPGLGRAALLSSALLLIFFLPALSPARQFRSFDDGRMHVPLWVLLFYPLAAAGAFALGAALRRRRAEAAR